MNSQIKEVQHTKQVLQKKSVFLVWLFSFLTLGIYAAFWYLKRKPEFDNLGTQKKLSKGLAITYLIFIIICAIYNLAIMIMGYTLQNVSEGNIILSVIVIPLIVLHLILAFNTRTILNDVWASKKITRKVSWLFTLIFGLFYLQYEINRTIDNRENEKRTGPWVCFIIFILISILIPVISILWIIVKMMNNL
jgi:hypothetical protein